MNKYYVINRWDVPSQMVFKIISTCFHWEIHPRFGHGSWNLFSGPFDTLDEAKESIPQEDT